MPDDPKKKTADPNANADDGDGEGNDAAGDAALEARIAKIANSAVTAQLKRELPKQLDAFKGDLAKLFDERLPKKPADDANGDGKGEGKGAAQKADPEMLKLKEQLEKLTKANEEERRLRTEAEERNRREKAELTLRTELVEKHGLRAEHAEALVDRWMARGTLKFNNDGEPVLTVKRARSKGARAEELEFSLSEGVADWAKGDDAKPWLPAAGASQANQRNAPRAPAGRSGGNGAGPAPSATSIDSAVADILGD